jgi:hypothetical protein
LCAQVFGEVKVEESPFLADLGARNGAGLGAGLQGVWVKSEEGGGFGEVERAHYRIQ